MLAISATADSSSPRHVEVQSLLGQRYDAVIDSADDLTFGLGIPRGSALPRRLYPIRHLGTPMIHRLRQPRFLEVLLRQPRRNHTEYLDPSPDPESESTASVPAPSVRTLSGFRVVLEWPGTTADWILEQTSSLEKGEGGWEAVPASSLKKTGETVTYTESTAGTLARFFRLRSP